MKYLNSNFITCRLQGRTGNMMFQIANGFVKALQYNRQYVVPSEESSSKHLEKTLFKKLEFSIKKVPSQDISKHIWSPFEYSKLELPSTTTPTVYAGWYQSEKFFEEYKEVVRDLFSPSYDFIERAFKDFPFLNDSVVVGINIRRGDYLSQSSRHPVVSLNYIREAYKELPVHDKLLIMSDDINWCKENIDFPNSIFIDPKDYWDAEGIWLFSLCDHFIISNSSYSWWSAWLSRNLNKKVITPSLWVGPDITDNVKDIWCDNWIKIPTIYNKGILEVAL